MIVTNAYNERKKFITICFVYDEIALREFIKSPLLSPSDIRVQHQGQEYVTQFDLAEVLMW